MKLLRQRFSNGEGDATLRIMNSKSIQLLAIVATCLILATGISSLMRSPGQVGSQKKPPGKKKLAQAEAHCTIKRAAFGGTQSALLKVMKGPVVHYVVLDHPEGNPMMPFYQRDWLEANYGESRPTVVGEFPTVEAAVVRAASLCKRN